MSTSRRTADGRNTWRIAALIMGCLIVAGCGDGKDRAKTYPVQGTATFQGEPMPGARINFSPIEGEAKERGLVPVGVVGEDGTFSVSTYETGDGAPAGRYKVTLVWDDESKMAAGGPGGGGSLDRFKGRYKKPDKSRIEVTITEGKNVLDPIKLP